MMDFQFSLPTKIIFGKNAEENIGKMSAALGKRALIMYGSSRVIDNGLMKKLTDQLEAFGITFDFVGGISPNPLLSEARKAADRALQFQADMILAVGSGSVIDAAKAACLGWGSKDLKKIYEGSEKPKKALPLGVVLTMGATASEANSVSVICDDITGKKSALTCPLTFPVFALMNPELTFSVPAKQTAIGAMDIFSHAFERYFHKTKRGVLRNYLCEGLMRTVVEELPRVLSTPDDYQARSELMWAATVAHTDILGCDGVYVCHGMSHILTAAFEMPHGMALGVLMPAWCKYVMVKNPEDIAGFARKVWNVDDFGMSVEHVAQEGIFRFQEFICNSGLPVTLREAGILNVDSAALAKQLMAGKSFIGENYEKMYEKDIQAMFDLAIG